MTSLKITKTEARRFMTSYHHLSPARKLKGKQGILKYIRRVNCIQYDPINLVGQNPHLLLQSRIENYSNQMLDELLYSDRKLLDGFDKVMSIYPLEDWPHFEQHRKHYRNRKYAAENVLISGTLRKEVLETVKRDGPISPIEIDIDAPVDWAWGSTKAGRAGLEMLFFDGEILIDHRKGTRRYFDLSERLLPKSLYSQADPHSTAESRKEWHVLRRVGGLGLAHQGAGEHWGGMLGMKAIERREILQRLLAQEKLISVEIESINRTGFYMRASDMAIMQSARKDKDRNPSAAIIAPLDNFAWDRNFLRWVFDFDYVWEVYKPEKQRKYGYYVLPILYNDQLIARFEPGFDRKSGKFEIKNWWWEEKGPAESVTLNKALRDCFSDFIGFLGASQFQMGKKASKAKQVNKIFAALL